MKEQIKKAKDDINELWKTLGEARDMSRTEFLEAQSHLIKVGEHNQTIYALMVDIADKIKEIEKLVLKSNEDTDNN